MINEVRNSVLTILNKNNYGYISPSDFNLMAGNAQMELYEEYYSNFNKTINAENMRSSGTDYANINKPMAEVLEQFLVSNFIVPKNAASGTPTNNFYVPSVTTVGNSAYMISKVIVYTSKIKSSINTSFSPFQLTASEYLFPEYTEYPKFEVKKILSSIFRVIELSTLDTNELCSVVVLTTISPSETPNAIKSTFNKEFISSLAVALKGDIVIQIRKETKK